MTFGLTDNGLIIPNTTQLLDQIAADQATSIDPNLNTSPDSVQGQENGIIAFALEQAYEVVEIAYNAFNPDAAEDFLLDALSALTGTRRQPATPSFFNGSNTVWVALAPNVTVPIGSLFGQAGDAANQYRVVLPVSSPVGAADKSTISSCITSVFTTSTPHGLIVGQAVQLATTDTFPTTTPAGEFIPGVYYVATASFGASTFTLSNTLANALAGSIIVCTGGSGNTICPAYVIPDARCTTAGPIPCNAGTLTTIVTPLSGLYSVGNPGNAFLGTPVDTDTQLRLRRELELRASGSGTIDAIRASIYEIEVNGVQPVISVLVGENTKDVIDPSGIPPHAFETLIYDGLVPGVPDNVIAQTIWDNKPAGILSSGNTSGTAIDSVGNQQIIGFSRPELIQLTIAVTIRVFPSLYDTTDVTTKAAIVASLKTRSKPGAIVAFSWIVAALSVLPGVESVEIVDLGSGSNLDYSTLGIRQYAYAVADGTITVTQVPVT